MGATDRIWESLVLFFRMISMKAEPILGLFIE